MTDFFQGILTIIFSFLLLPFVLHAVGGMAGFAKRFRTRTCCRWSCPGKIGRFFVVMFALQALMGIVAQPFIMGVCAVGTHRNGRPRRIHGRQHCQTTVHHGLECHGAWPRWPGTCSAASICRTIKPDHVYGDVARAFLPAVMPGLLGIFLASLLASVMSSCDAFMISSSGLFTENIYKPLRPGQPEKHYVTVGRWRR